MSDQSDTPDLLRHIQNIDRAIYELQRRRIGTGLSTIISGSAPQFDATIDPAATANDASSHLYVNLAGVVAGETGWTSTRQLVVRLIGRPNSFATETGNVTIPGPLVLTGIGQSGPYEIGLPTTGSASKPLWDTHGFIITGSSTNIISLNNVHVFSNASSSTSVPFASATVLHMTNSNISQYDFATTNVRISGLGAGSLIAYNSNFYGVWPMGNAGGTNAAFLHSCSLVWGTLNTQTLDATHLMCWVGGQIGFVGTGTPAVTISGGEHIIIGVHNDASATAWNGSLGGSAANATLTISSTNPVTIETFDVFFTVTVAAGAGHVNLRGRYGILTQSGNTNSKLRRYDVQLTGSSNTGIFGLDLTAYCEAKVHMSVSVSDKYKVAVRGTSVHLDATMAYNLQPALSLIGATDCLIKMICTAPSSAQAYTIDGTSARCVVIFAGVTNAGFTVGSTNTGTNCLVITEAGVQPLGTITGDLAGSTYPALNVAGIAAASLDIKIGTVGKGVYVKEGTNATMGVATLVAGTVVVSTTKVTANSRIHLTVQALGTVLLPAAIAVTARTAGTSFTITSADVTDTSTVGWVILEPA